MTRDVSVVSRVTDTTIFATVSSAYSSNGAAVAYSTASVSAEIINTSSHFGFWYKVDSGSWLPVGPSGTASVNIDFSTQTLTTKLAQFAGSSVTAKLVIEGVPVGLYAEDEPLSGVDAAALAALGVYAHQPITTKTANYTATVNDRIIFVDATSGNVTITLPAASASGAGYSQSLRIKRIDDSVNTVTVQRAGADTIDGETNTTISPLQSKDFNSNGVSLWGVC